MQNEKQLIPKLQIPFSQSMMKQPQGVPRIFVNLYVYNLVLEIVAGKTTFFNIFRYQNYLKVSEFYLLILPIFWKKGGNSSRGDIIQGRILIKEIRYMIYPVWNRSVCNYPKASSLLVMFAVSMKGH